MEATSGERKKIDIAATIDRHKTFVPQFLKAHAIFNCDTVAYFYGIGKGKIVKKMLSGMKLTNLADIDANIDDIVSAAKEKQSDGFMKRQNKLIAKRICCQKAVPLGQTKLKVTGEEIRDEPASKLERWYDGKGV